MNLSVSTRVEVTRSEPLTSDRLLRRLEVARQQLSVRWCGHPGSFAGYDVLDIHSAAPDEGSVLFAARLLARAERSHLVELTAVDELTGTVLLKGHGRTVEVPQSRAESST